VGHAWHPREEAVRFCQEPSLAFAPSTVWTFVPANEGRPPRLFSNFLGLLGPNGPLPLHLTDYARDRERNHGDASMARFLDLFNHRILALFYRAWASNHQAVEFQRGNGDRFADYIASLIGLGLPPLRNRDAVPDVAKLHYSGRLACQTRHAEGLRAILQDYFGVTAAIEEFVGEWVSIPVESRCRLGESPMTGAVGGTAVVGSRVWDCQQKFRIRLGPMSLTDYRRLLPGGDSFRRLVSWVRNYAGDAYAWDVRLVLRAADVPRLRLGTMGQLGWTTWATSKPVTEDQENLVLQPTAA
jgi:type VI secretion system protein ImpH